MLDVGWKRQCHILQAMLDEDRHIRQEHLQAWTKHILCIIQGTLKQKLRAEWL